MNKALKSLVLIIGLLLTFIWIRNILTFKYDSGPYCVKIFYEQDKNTIDLLVLGSSHAYQDINTGILYTDFGLASYNLCGSMQPIWNSYFYLVEALKTQSPKLIVLEAYRLTQSSDYSDSSTAIKNTYGLKWTKNKIDSIRASVNENEWLEYALEWVQWHNRYEEVSQSDFRPYLGNEEYYKTWKGYTINFHSAVFDKVVWDDNFFNTCEPVALTEKVEEYYRKIIELAQKEEIPILVVVSPYSGYNMAEAGKYKYAEKIADEYGVMFIDYNRYYDELEMDFEQDFADVGHLSWLGSHKYTTALGKYIVNNYLLPDRRNDPAYISWQKNAEILYRKEQNNLLHSITDTKEYFNQLLTMEENYTIIINLSGEYISTNWNTLVNPLGISEDEYSKGGTWLLCDKNILYNYTGDDYLFCGDLDKYNEVILNKNQENGQDSILINGLQYMRTYNGMTVVVYDSKLKTIVDHVALSVDSNESIIR